MTWWQQSVAEIDTQALQRAQDRQLQLTKPTGSLGRLEDLAITFSGWQGTELPVLQRIVISVFAADHGVVEEGVSAYPQVVTGEMIRNFSRGGAAITVLARQHQAEFTVINLGTVLPVEPLPRVVNIDLGPGTANFTKQAAMSAEQLEQAMLTGAEQVPDDCQLFLGGEMGIGNTTTAAAIASALLDIPVEDTVGKGTGLDDQGVHHKQQVVEKALDLHRSEFNNPIEVLRLVGGFEIAALAGAYIAAAQQGVPSLIDGYITSVAALLACRLNPAVRDWMLFAHCSAEPGHKHVLQALDAQPILDLGMRLGEGSGSAVALSIIKSALVLQCEMATFVAADVSDKS